MLTTKALKAHKGKTLINVNEALALSDSRHYEAHSAVAILDGS